MSLQIAVIDISTPTSTGSQTYTPGFQPTALILIGGESTGAGTTTNASIVQGFAVSSSSQVCVGNAANDAVATGSYDEFSWQDVSNFIKVYDGTSGTTVLIAAAVSSITSTTFVLNFTTVSATSRKLTVIALGGTDLTGAEIVNFQEPSSTGNQNVATTLGTPAGILLLSSGQALNTTNVAAAFNYISGWSFGSSSQMSTFHSLRVATGVQLTNACIAASMGLTSIDAKATLSSFSNNQFTLNWSNVYTTTRFYTFALVLYGTFQAASFSNNSPTSTGTQSNSLSFSPALAYTQSIGNAPSTGVQNTVACYSTGIYDGTNNRVSAIDIQAPFAKINSTAKSYYQSTEMLEMYDATAGTPVKLVEAAGSSLSSGVQLNFTTVNATARQYIGWALGSGTGGGGGGGSSVPTLTLIASQGTMSGGMQMQSGGLQPFGGVLGF